MEVVREATSPTDLSHLLAFVEQLLPVSCGIHSQLVYRIRWNSPADRFYYLRDPSAGQGSYLAVAGLTRHERLDSTRNIQKSWRMTGWASHSEHLDRLLRDIDAVDWAQDYVALFLLESDLSPKMQAFLFPEKNKEIARTPFVVRAISLNEAASFEPRIPEEIYVKGLDPGHAVQVHGTWSGKDSTSVDCITDVITRLPSVGIFLKTNDQLVAWAVSHRPGGGISHLYTLEEHRGKGYGLLAVQCLSKQLAQIGLIPFATINHGNEASIKLFAKSGFQYVQNILILY